MVNWKQEGKKRMASLGKSCIVLRSGFWMDEAYENRLSMKEEPYFVKKEIGKMRQIEILITILIVFCLMCFAEAEADSSGSCGTNLNWTLTDSGVLTISGNGDMVDCYKGDTWRSSYRYYSIKKVIIEEGVTSIQNMAFHTCTSLTTVVLPETLTHIGDSAFAGCSKLSEMSLPSSLVEIGGSAFSGCGNLQELVFPDSLTHIGNGAFSSCSSWKKVTWPSQISEIENTTFQQCTQLTEIILPEGLVKIGDLAFTGCTALKSISIPASVTEIGNKVFDNCSSLEAVHISEANSTYASDDGVLYDLAKTVLMKCPEAKAEVSIPSGVLEIADHAFQRCRQLKEIKVPSSVNRIGSGAFLSCSSLESIELPEGIVNISMTVFAACTSLQSIVIPETVGRIDEFAFRGCTSLQSIVIPLKVSKILENAFKDCTSLTSVLYLGSEEDWKNVTIESGNEMLLRAEKIFLYGQCGVDLWWILADGGELIIQGSGGMYTYEAGKAPWEPLKELIQSITVGSGVTGISEGVFQNCINLSRVSLPSTLIQLRNAPFAGCLSLAEINLESGNSEYTVENGILYNKAKTCMICCPAMCENAVIPESVTDISAYAFAFCTRLTSLTIPVDVNSIGDLAFYGCISLNDIHVTSGNAQYESVDGILYMKTEDQLMLSCCPAGKNEVHLAEGTTVIGEDAFSLCHKLKSIEIPDGVNTLREYAFSDCLNLAEITIPKSVSSIGENAFEGTQLKAVYYKGTEEQWNSISVDEPNSVLLNAEIHWAEPLMLTLPERLLLQKGESGTLLVQVTPEGTYSYSWESSDTTVAVVDEKGLVTAIDKGSVQIAVRVTDGTQEASAECEVRVYPEGILYLPQDLSIIESEALSSLSEVGMIVVPAGVTVIADDAFSGADVFLSVEEGIAAMDWAETHGVEYVIRHDTEGD